MLYRFVIAFLPRSKPLLISWLESLSTQRLAVWWTAKLFSKVAALFLHSHQQCMRLQFFHNLVTLVICLFSSSLFLVFIFYLAVWGLSCSTWDLCCGPQALLVVAHGTQFPNQGSDPHLLHCRADSPGKSLFAFLILATLVDSSFDLYFLNG